MTGNDASAGTKAPLRIDVVRGKADLDDFIEVPNVVLRSDPAWVPPLHLERRMSLSPKTNPYFEHAKWQAWVARRNGKLVGRISAQVDQLHLERYADATGFFGMLDAEDDPETFAALLDTAEQWLREQGMQRVRGPFSLSINEETGLLVDGFDTPPVFMMGHARPYYGERVEQHGYRKAVDTFAYMVAPDFEAPAAMRRLAQRYSTRLRVRPINTKRFDQELEVLRDIFNDAWAGNWGFLPYTEAEFRELGKNLRLLISPELIQVAEIDGEPVAFIVGLPNINEAVRDLRGRLLPFGWLKLLWRIKVRFPQTARVPLMGVRRKFHETRLGAAIAFALIDTVRSALHRRGVREVEMSWVLEGNTGMRDLAEAFGGRAYKRYRVYERELA